MDERDLAMNIKERLKALEQLNTVALRELPMIVNDICTDEEIKQLQRIGRIVYRYSDTSLIEEYI